MLEELIFVTKGLINYKELVGFQPIIENFMNLFMYLLCIQRQGLLTVFALNTIELHIYYCSFTNYYHKFQE